MKRLLMGFVVLVLLVLSGFGGKQATTTKQAASSSRQAKSSKVLVLYYSNSGTTKAAAEKIHKQVGGDIVKMTFNVKYPGDYTALTKVAKNQIDKNIQPKITNLPNLSKYQTILIGFPTWYHRPPMFINTFFASGQLKNKTVIPFTTSMESPISESTPYLKKMATGTSATLQTGFRANNSATVTRYLKKAGLVK